MLLNLLFSGCALGQFYLNGFCHDHCPKTFYAFNKTFPGNITFKEYNVSQTGIPTESPKDSNPANQSWWLLVCERCHANCYECVGPKSSDCVSCSDGFKFLPEHVCVKMSVMDQVKGYMDLFRSHPAYGILAVVAVCCVGALLVFGTVFIILQLRSWSQCRKKDDGRFTRSDKLMRMSLGKSMTVEPNGSVDYIAQRQSLLSEQSDSDEDFEGEEGTELVYEDENLVYDRENLSKTTV